MLRVLLPLWLTIVVSAEPPQNKAAATPAAPAKKPEPPPPAAAEAAPPSDQTNPEHAKSLAISRMQSSIDKQLASVRKQATGYIALDDAPPNGAFLLPWPKPATPATNIAFHEEIACDPMPEAEIDLIVNDAATRQKVSPKVVRAMITQESGGRPCAVSHAGAQGLMQLMPEVQRELAVDDPFDPRQSVEAGAKLLKTLMDRYVGDLPKALAAYNAGPGAVDRASGVPPIPETINYVAKIVKRIE